MSIILRNQTLNATITHVDRHGCYVKFDDSSIEEYGFFHGYGFKGERVTLCPLSYHRNGSITCKFEGVLDWGYTAA